MGKLSRTKGHAFERSLARRFREMGWPEAARTLHETRDGNCGDLVHVKPFSVQAKCGAAPSVWKALSEAVLAADPGDYSVAVLKRDRAVPIVAMTLDDFCELVGKLKQFGVL